MSKVTKLSIAETVQQYVELRRQQGIIKSQMDKLSSDIKTYAEANGVRDDKGSFYAETSSFIYGKQAKKSVKFDTPKAIEFFKRNGMASAISTVEVINEDVVEKLIGTGMLKIEDFEAITTTDVTYAVMVKPKEEMPEVQQSTTSLPVAASKKSVLHLKKK